MSLGKGAALLSLVVASWLVPARVAFAQEPAFEVASVKIGTIGDGHPLKISGKRVSLGVLPLRGLILYAYNVRDYQISNGPSLFDTNYEIDAVVPGAGAPTVDQVRHMLRTLLADRFKLKIRVESKDLPVYALVIGKNGSKLKESTLAADKPVQMINGMTRFANPRCSMATFAIVLSSLLDRPVIDRTGLSGTFDIDLTFQPGVEPLADGPENNFAPVAGGAPALFTAVQETLGLRLQSTRDPMQFIVVEHWEKPTAN